LVGVLKGTAAQPAGEFEQLADVDGVFGALEKLLDEASTDAVFGTANVAGTVQGLVQRAKANRKLLQEQAEADAADTLESALEVAAYGIELGLVVDPVDSPALEAVPAALGVVSALIALGKDVYAFYDEEKPKSQTYVEDDTDLIKDEVHNLQADFSARYSSIGDTLEHYRQLIKTDSAKLAAAEVNVANTWDMQAPDEIRMKAAIGTSLQRELYSAVMPIAYKQWLVSPRATDIDPGAFADQPNRHYNCREGRRRRGAQAAVLDLAVQLDDERAVEPQSGVQRGDRRGRGAVHGACSHRQRRSDRPQPPARLRWTGRRRHVHQLAWHQAPVLAHRSALPPLHGHLRRADEGAREPGHEQGRVLRTGRLDLQAPAVRHPEALSDTWHPRALEKP
jgi:hypothetical protein